MVRISISTKFFTVFFASKSQGLNTVTALRTGFSLSSSGGELVLVAAKGDSDVRGNEFISVTYGWYDDSNNNFHDAIYHKIWLESDGNV
ncbi:MAG: hypothetical protein ACRD5J_12130 [Nitrososphaeraceae archaeon]